MSDETKTTQGDTAAATSSETITPEETVLKPASAMVSGDTKPTDVTQTDLTGSETSAETKEAGTETEGNKDLGVLSSKGNETEGAPEAYEDFTLPDGLELEAEDVAALKEIAKDSNFTQAQAQVGAEMTAKALKQLVSESEAKQSKWRDEQKTLWDSQPDSATRTLLAEKALKHSGLLDYVVENGYAHDSQLMKAFSEFGKLVSEAKVIIGTESNPKVAPNPYNNSPEFK